MKKYLSKESFKEYKDIYRKKGLKALLKKLGWRVFAFIFIFYLIRDIILYVIGPKIFLDILSSYGISTSVTYPFISFFVILLFTYLIFRYSQDIKIRILRTASFFGFLYVVLGAFGAHGLEDALLALGNESKYATAVDYHVYHTFLLLGLGLLSDKYNLKNIKRSFIFCLLGIFIFSGSLYLFSLTEIKWLVYLTPIGGFSFILAWFFLFLSVSKVKK